MGPRGDRSGPAVVRQLEVDGACGEQGQGQGGVGRVEAIRPPERRRTLVYSPSTRPFDRFDRIVECT